MADQLGRWGLFYANRPPERIPELEVLAAQKGREIWFTDP